MGSTSANLHDAVLHGNALGSNRVFMRDEIDGPFEMHLQKQAYAC